MRESGVVKIVFLILMLIPISGLLVARSIHRPEHQFIPEIITRWENDTKTYSLKNWYLSERPVFHLCNKTYFNDHLLPQDDIPFRNDEENSVKGSELSERIDELIEEIHQKKTTFKHFKVLKKEDFNWKEPAGMLAFKFKEYPFVVKLFLETPQSFVLPYSKGWRPGFFFIMGKGVTRYLSGFTRIPNLENIKKKLEESPYWSQVTDTPRKWYYIPEKVRWFEVFGKNLNASYDPYIKLPSVYAIVADAINGKSLKVYKGADRKFGIKLAQYVGNALDAHIDNFIIEDETKKVVIIDSEHFITATGISPQMRYSKYTQWYLQIAWKATKDLFFRGKYSRRYKYICEPMPKEPLPIENKITKQSITTKDDHISA